MGCGARYDGCKDFERPKYGVLNVMNDHRGVVRAAQYGDCYLIMKDVRLRATFSPEDSTTNPRDPRQKSATESRRNSVDGTIWLQFSLEAISHTLRF